MKRLQILFSGLMISLFMFVGLTSVVHAQSFRSGSTVSISKNETIRETVFASGRDIIINGQIYGDVFCAGQSVTINAAVHGDVICAGQTVTVGGRVLGDVRLAGQSVTLNGEVTGNASIGAQSFNLAQQGRIGGDASIGATDSTFSGSIGRDLAIGGQGVSLAGNVDRNVQVNATDITLTGDARVNGSLHAVSTNQVNKQPGAVVSGGITRAPPAQSSKPAASTGSVLLWLLYWLLAMLLIALALALLFPRALHAISDEALPRPWRVLLIGFVAAFAVPFILFLLALTVIGIPLALLVGLCWLLIVLFSSPVFAYYIGRLILRHSRQPLLIMLVGALVLIVLYLIPFLNILTGIIAVWVGSGMLLSALFKRTPRPEYSLGTESAA